jgi:hypothetical protein
MSLALKLVNCGYFLAERVGLGPSELDADELLSAACRSTNLWDFGEEDIRTPLSKLLASYCNEASLSPFGRHAARWDVLRLLTNLLVLREQERQHPEVLTQPIERPIFITGVPRSGTTFLHALLAEDPSNLAPRCWQTIYPYPLHARIDNVTGIAQVNRQLRVFRRLAPELANLHPLDAERPQECTEINAHVFRSLRFDSTHDVPSYRDWLHQAGHIPAYRFHRRFLQHLQRHTGPKQWVLKSPDHVFALPALLSVYPDARLVFVHRDPLKVLPSVARLTQVLRTPFASKVDPMQIGRQVSLDWAIGVGRIIEAAQTWPAERIFHVQYRTLIHNPIDTVATLYRHFGIGLSTAATKRMEAFLAQLPRGGYGQNSYRFEDFGLDPEFERARYREYMRVFAIEPEVDVAQPRKASLKDLPSQDSEMKGKIQVFHGL